MRLSAKWSNFTKSFSIIFFGELLIRNDKDGTGDTVEKVELKVSQYGDDNKGFLNCPRESIDGILLFI